VTQLDPFKWSIDLSIPGAPIENTNRQLERLIDKLEEANSFVNKLKQGFANKIASGLLDSIASIPSAITGALGKLTDLAFGFGKVVVEAVSMREQSIIGFEALYKGAENAEELFNQTLRIAKLTKFETKEVVESFNALASAGFKAKDLTAVYSAIADVSSARTEKVGKVFQANLERVNLQGYATLANIGALIRTGTGQEGYLQLGKVLGLVDKGETTVTPELIAKIRKAAMNKDKKISSDVAITAVLDAVSQKYDKGGPLGGFAIQAGTGSLQGLLSNLKDSLQDTIAGLNLDTTSFPKFKTFLQDINGFLIGGTAESKRFGALVKNLIDDVFSLFDLKGGSQGTKALFNKVLDVAEALEKRVKSFFFWIRDTVIPGALSILTNPDGIWAGVKSALADIASYLGTLIGQAISAIIGEEGAKFGATIKEYLSSFDTWEEAKEKVNTKFDQDKFNSYIKLHPEVGSEAKKLLTDAGNAIGQAFGFGISQGITDSKDVVSTAAKEMGENAENSIREQTETHSPSKKFFEIGKGLAQGLQMGFSETNGTDGIMSEFMNRNRYETGDNKSSAPANYVTINVTGSDYGPGLPQEIVNLMRRVGRVSLSPNASTV